MESVYKKNITIEKIIAFIVLFAVFVFMFYTMWQNYYMLILIMLTGFMLVYFILKGIQVAENRNYLPYVPALSISALYFIFFVMG